MNNKIEDITENMASDGKWYSYMDATNHLRINYNVLKNIYHYYEFDTSEGECVPFIPEPALIKQIVDDIKAFKQYE